MNNITSRVSEADLAVRLRNLRKVYKLYRNPAHRLRDIMGLLPADKRYYDEHVALHGVTLDIRRGEKVAIIGRNGAGKSTLLRLITKVIEPTSGTIEVNGDTQALLSLGTGFHPEFTGRQNVAAYLANFGITGAEAERMIRDVVDFAELEEYIDQPTKTYSTGMNMRLMFAASTMFVPDLLVIDEVLGVGDAYFQGKSFERIREICSAQGATLLLVSHDIYTASTLCDRMIWIDHGAVLLDADSATVLRAYDASIRQQEEARLRKKALLNLERMTKDNTKLTTFLIELRSPDNKPTPTPVAVARMALLDGGLEVASAALTDEREPAGGVGQIVKDSGVWGDVTVFKGREARQINNFGSSLHKAAVSFMLPSHIASRLDDLTLEIEAGADGDYRLEVWRVDADLRTRSLGILPSAPGEWSLYRAPLSGASLSGAQEEPVDQTQAVQAVQAAEVHGSGRVTATGVRVLDAAGNETLLLAHGQPIKIVLDYRINDPTMRERCDVIFAFKRNGVDDVFRIFNNKLVFDTSKSKTGSIVAIVDRMPLGDGEYSVASIIAEENYYYENQNLFFAINPKVYWARRSIIEFKVTSTNLVAKGTAVVGEADWEIEYTQDSTFEPALVSTLNFAE